MSTYKQAEINSYDYGVLHCTETGGKAKGVMICVHSTEFEAQSVLSGLTFGGTYVLLYLLN